MHQIAQIEAQKMQNFLTQGGSAPLQPPPGASAPSIPTFVEKHGEPRIYTSGSRGVIMVKCLSQGHNMLTIMGLEPTTFCL